jgi:uncharacterized protein with GYD domain
MAKYAIFFKFTGATIKGMMDRPSDRAAVVSTLLEGVGGRMESYYLMFGGWDGFVVCEAPDSAAAAAVSLAVTSTGAFASLETHELIEVTGLAGILAKASSLTYSAPGA